jgi:transposase
VLKARGRQRTDSTHVLAAVRAINRIEVVGETVRSALNSLAVVAPQWLQAQLSPEWMDRYRVRFNDYRLPRALAPRQALAEAIGADGLRLLQAIYDPAAPAWLREVPAVEILRQVWVQQYHATADGPVQWRDAANLPPANRLVQSPYDPGARFTTKRETRWTGYKVHLTETCSRLSTWSIRATLTPNCSRPVRRRMGWH